MVLTLGRRFDKKCMINYAKNVQIVHISVKARKKSDRDKSESNLHCTGCSRVKTQASQSC